jgi:hypothetical protein
VPVKQQKAKPFFQKFHLVTDRSLGYKQLIRSTREAAVTRSRFKSPHGIEWW